MKKYRKFVEAFFSFRPLKLARSCDEIAVTFGEAMWIHLSAIIATLSKSLSGKMLMVWLYDANNKYKARRLNAILDYLSEMGINHGVRYHVEKIADRGHLDEMVYVTVGGRKFLNCSISLVINLETKRVEVFANDDDEVVFFRDSPELKELGRRVSEAINTINHLCNEIKDLIAVLVNLDLPPELYERYRRLYDEYLQLCAEYNKITKGLVVVGEYMIAAYVRHLDRIRAIPKIADKLANIRKEFAELVVYAQLAS